MALLDDFGRADGDLGSNWLFPIEISSNDSLLIDGSEAGGITSGYFTSYWAAQTFGPNIQVDVDVSAIDSSGSYAILWVRVENPGTESVSGYQFGWSSAGFGFWQTTAGVIAQLGSTVTGDLNAGDTLRVRIVGTTLYGFVVSGGTATLMLTVEGTLPAAAGYIGLGVDEATFRFDNFSAGSYATPSQPSSTQTLDQLIFLVARRYGRALSSEVTTAGAINNFTDINIIDPSKTWINYYLRWTGGTNVGVERLVTAYDQATSLVTVSPDLPDEAVAGDTYYLLPLPYQYFKDAIVEAVRVASGSWMVIRDDATTLMFTTEQDYALPADLISLIDVYAGRNGFWYPFTTFEVVGNFSAYRLVIRDWPQIPVTQAESMSTIYGAEMRLVYYALVDSMEDGSLPLGLTAAGEREIITFIQEYALHILHESAMARNVTGEEARVHFSLSQQHYKTAMATKAARTPQKVIRRMRTRAIPSLR